MRERADSLIFYLVVGSASAALLSIAVSQILLVAACLAWILARPRRPYIPTYFLPVLALFLATALSLAANPSDESGIGALYKFWIFSIGLLAANFVSSQERAHTAMRVLLAIGAVAAVAGIVQFGLLYSNFLTTGALEDNPIVITRISGTLGHPMTFSGTQLLVWAAGVPSLLVLGRKWIIPAALVSAAIVLSFTRSAWIGAAAGFSAVGLALPRRLLMKLMLPVLVVAAAASGLVYQRIAMSFEAGFAPNYARIAYLQAGLQMIRDHPLVGVGPGHIAEEFVHYHHADDLDSFYYGHLHNNFVQIAAERGLIALAALIWLFVDLYRTLIRGARAGPADVRWLALSGLAALTGFLVAGLFEYNFSDSEVLTLLLFIVSIHLGVLHRHETPAAPAGE